MAMQFRCQNEIRSQVLRDSSIPLNGIDYLEVLHQDAPAGTMPQRTLLVRMLKTAPWGLSAANVQISGGVRVTDIHVVWTLKASEASQALVTQGQISAAEKDFYLALPESDQVLVVRTDTAGDFSHTRCNSSPRLQTRSRRTVLTRSCPQWSFPSRWTVLANSIARSTSSALRSWRQSHSSTTWPKITPASVVSCWTVWPW